MSFAATVEHLEIVVTSKRTAPKLGTTGYLESIIGTIADIPELGIEHEKVHIKVDGPYDFALTIPILQSRGMLTIGSSSTTLLVARIINTEQLAIARAAVLRVSKVIDADAASRVVTCAIHASLSDEHLGFFEPAVAGFALTGFIGAGSFPPWERQVRLVIDNSQLLPKGAFIHWQTDCPEPITETVAEAMAEGVKAATNAAGLTVYIR